MTSSARARRWCAAAMATWPISRRPTPSAALPPIPLQHQGLLHRLDRHSQHPGQRPLELGEVGWNLHLQHQPQLQECVHRDVQSERTAGRCPAEWSRPSAITAPLVAICALSPTRTSRSPQPGTPRMRPYLTLSAAAHDPGVAMNSNISEVNSIGTSNYNGMWAVLTKNMSHGPEFT